MKVTLNKYFTIISLRSYSVLTIVTEKITPGFLGLV